MNYWKPIVASLVIFVSGLVSGVILTKSLVSPPVVDPVVERGPRPWENSWFMGRMERELDLTPEQKSEIEALLVQSQEDIRDLFEPVMAQDAQIKNRLQEDMRALMATPEQAEKFDQLMSRPPRGRGGPGGSRGGGGPRGGGPGDGFGGGERGGNRGDFDGRGERGDFGRRDGDRQQGNRSDRSNQSSTNSAEGLTETTGGNAESTSGSSEETSAPAN